MCEAAKHKDPWNDDGRNVMVKLHFRHGITRFPVLHKVSTKYILSPNGNVAFRAGIVKSKDRHKQPQQLCCSQWV